MKMRKPHALAIFGFLLVGSAAIAAPSVPRYSVTDLGRSEAVAVNSQGHVALTLTLTSGRIDDPTMTMAALWNGRSTIKLGTLGGRTSAAVGLNDADVVIGSAETHNKDENSLFIIRPFVWRHGHMNDFLQSVNRQGYSFYDVGVTAINNAGHVAFRGIGKQHQDHSYLWRPNALTRFTQDSPSKSFGVMFAGRLCDGAEPVAVNDHDEVIVHFQASGLELAGAWRRGRSAFLPTPPIIIEMMGPENHLHPQQVAPNYHAYGINNHGVIVGQVAFEARGVCWKNGRLTYLPVLRELPRWRDHPWYTPKAINNSQQIVGHVVTQFGQGKSQAVLWKKHRAFNLNRLLSKHSGWDLQEAVGINDRGQIVGEGLHRGLPRAFLLTPVAH